MWPALRCQPAGVALHVVRRGVARCACFFRASERVAYLAFLREQTKACDCALHAYVLMANHVHLLLTPRRADAAARLVGALEQRYARHLAARHGTAGSLWQDGLAATPVYARRYLLACMRYIELNPVRACLAARPEAYRWSSYRANGLGEHDALLTPHPLYCALGRSPEARRTAYRALFRSR